MENRQLLDNLVDRFKHWMHVEDPQLIYTMAAAKISHKIPGDPIWLMVIGPSSGGKTEYLRAFTRDGEPTIEDLTKNSFISGYKSAATDHIPQFAEQLKDNVWYIYDLSILMSKRSEERSEILSQLRLIYDGKLTKPYGNKQVVTCDTSNNTLICATTPVIDATMLEDQALGTRFIHYRMPPINRKMIMEMIDQNMGNMAAMRGSIKAGVNDFETNIQIEDVTLTEMEEESLHLLSNMTTLLRTSVQTDRQGEPRAVAAPEDPGRLYKQVRKLYTCYRMIGLDDVESLKCIKKICVDNINPLRIKLLDTLYKHNEKDDYGRSTIFSTSKLHGLTGMGKKSIKEHMHALHLLGMVHFGIIEENFGRTTDQWRLLDNNLMGLLINNRKSYFGRSLARIFCKHKLT